MSAANGMGIGRRLLLVAALIHGAACNCSPGFYKHLTSCLRCSAGQFSTAINSATCDACGPGQFASATGSTACAACSPGKYARFYGLSVCFACPSGTGSEAGATECMSCIPGVNATSDNTTTAVPINITTTAVPITNTTCRTAALKPCVSCPVACTACVPGKYNDGAAPKCASCAPGTYSAAVQAVSSMTCSLCEPGTSTRPTDTGMTSCTQCEALNQTVPLNAVADSSAGDPLVCGWSCEPGYTLLNVSAAGFNDSAYVATGYTASQAVRLFYAQHNYCCNPTLTSIGPGLYLKGCNRTYDGDAAACPPVANGNYFFTGVKVDHCADWVCEEGYYSNGTVCIKQRACDPGFTYRRDAAGVIARMAFGAFECVPCSVCAAGATLLRACNGSVDTRCAMCPSTHFSVSGGPCIAAPPLGSIGVVVRLTALPPFQGRPSVYWDGTAIQWGSVNFATGFFMNAYTPCQPLDPYLTYKGGDAPCSRLDTATAACVLPKCKSQCKPWNGTAGWYLVPATGLCTPCAYDPTCGAAQYSNMDVCGPTSAPQCTACPAALPANALGWANPGRILTGYPPCDVVCRNGFIRTDNFTCIYCPNLPENSKVTVGCSWVCSLGYLQVGNLCVRCTNEPVACGVGTYLGYADGLQCAKCLPCTNAVPNSIFVSAGGSNGPNTCGLRCNPGTFIDPRYGLDVFGNPIVCAECSVPQCEGAFLVGCTPDSDAYCAPCSDCPVGYDVRLPCTIGADTVCQPCDASLLPPNAVWTAAGCEKWECADSFYSSNDRTRCLPCQQPRNCTKSDRFDYIAAGCGVCTPCDPGLLRQWQCFNGDGQCGTTYKCGFVTTQTPTTTRPTTARPTTTTTTPPPSTTPPPASSYATLMTVTIPRNVSLADLLKSVRCNHQCTIQIASTVCEGRACRRLMDSGLMTVEIVVLSPQPLVPAIEGGTVRPVSVATTPSYFVNDAAILGSVAQLTSFIKIEKDRDDAPLPLLVIGVAAGVCLVLLVLVIIAIAGAERPPVDATVRAQFNWDGIRIGP